MSKGSKWRKTNFKKYNEGWDYILKNKNKEEPLRKSSSVWLINEYNHIKIISPDGWPEGVEFFNNEEITREDFELRIIKSTISTNNTK